MYIEKVRAKLDDIAQKTQNPNIKGVCSHIKDIIGESEHKAEIVLTDLDNGFKIEDCEKQIENAARGDRNKKCCMPWDAEKIICEFFGISPEDDAPVKKKKIDLADLL